MTMDTGGWKLLGETTHSKYYLVEEAVIAIVPDPGTVDDVTTAREVVSWFASYCKKAGQRHASIVLLENVVSQDMEARRVYQTELDPELQLCAALVGGTILSRAIGSFFLGVNRPRVPTRMFATFDEGLAWARQLRDNSTENKSS